MTPTPDLTALANRVARLSPDWQRPERFYEQRSELAHEIRRIALDHAPRLHIEKDMKMSYVSDQTRRVVRAYRELKQAEDAVRAAGLIPMATDSAFAVYDDGLKQLGVSASERKALAVSGAPGLATVFLAWAKAPMNRRALAMDQATLDARTAGAEARFPGMRIPRQIA